MSDQPIPESRWYHPTPGKLVAGLLVVEVCFFLADRLSVFGLKRNGGWNALLAAAIMCLAILAGLVWFALSVLLRRRFQFGIRTLFLLLLTATVPCGWFSHRIRNARQRQDVVMSFQETGGRVQYDFQRTGKGEPLCPRSLQRWLGEDFFSEVVAASCNTVAQLLPSVDPAMDLPLWHPNLEAMSSSNRFRRFGNADAARLHNLPKLRWLDLSGKDVDDTALEHLTELKELESLWLHGTQVTDAGLAHLEKLPLLESLGLNFTEISDAGLEHLKTQTDLKQLWLRETRVTEEGVRQLRQALPNCEIYHGALSESAD